MINPVNRHSPLRMMGLSSGMDTDFIIQQTMRIHQMKIDSRMRSRTTLEWKQQLHTGIRDELRAFRQSFLTTIGPNAMMSSSVYNASIAKISGSNAGAVSIKTNSGSSLGNLSINSVTQLAQGARATASNVTGLGGKGLSPNARLGDILGGSITFTDDTMRVRTGDGDGDYVDFFRDSAGNYTLSDGTAVPFSTTTNTHGLPAERFTGDAVIAGGAYDGLTFELRDGYMYMVKPALDEDSNPVMIEKKDALGNTVYDTDGVTPLMVPGEVYTLVGLQSWGTAQVDITGPKGTDTVELNRGMTVNQMVSEVNKSGAGVTMVYDQLKDEFRIETNETRDPITGEVQSRAGESLILSGQAFEALGLITGTPGSPQTFGGAQDAKVIVNGDYTNPVISSTNSFDFRGINITLNKTFNVDSAGNPITTGEAVEISVTRDTDSAFNKIKAFVDSYNSIISKLEKLLKERKTSSESTYMPLTDEEKAQMSDKQIEDWETIAKKGLLRNDSAIQGMVTSLRRALFDEVEGAGLSPSQIGLSTGDYFSGTGGQIMIDETKLRAALEDDPDKVMSVFMNGAGSKDYKERGLLYRISDIMGGYLSEGATNTLDGLDRSIRQANTQIQRLQEKMWREEDRLYKQFAAMETALSNMQSQGDWFAAMLGGTKS